MGIPVLSGEATHHLCLLNGGQGLKEFSKWQLLSMKVYPVITQLHSEQPKLQRFGCFECSRVKRVLQVADKECIDLQGKKNYYCLACIAEARQMYCFSGGGVVVVSGGVNFFMFRSFSQKL